MSARTEALGTFLSKNTHLLFKTLFAVCLFAVSSVSAATMTVVTTSDSAVAGDGLCTLREAINNANNDNDTSGGDCGAGLGTDTINLSVVGTIQLNTFLPDLNTNININGISMSDTIVRRNGGGDYRIFTIAAGRTVRITGLRVTNGRFSAGGGITNFGNLTLDGVSVDRNSVPEALGGVGGGIYSLNGSLVILNSSITNNFTTGYSGGGVYSNGTTIIRNSTISGNEVDGGDVFSAGCGGGAIFFGTTTLVNVTVSGNTVNHVTLEADGGGLCSSGSANLRIINSTIASNRSQDGVGGGIYVEGGNVFLKNTLFADNSADDGGNDISGAVSSEDYNFIEDTNGATINGATAHNITGINPLLAPLAFNGGMTQTHRALPGSPVLDKGAAAIDPSNGSSLITIDQRAAPRPFDLDGVPNAAGGNGSDIGAFELVTALTVNNLGDLPDALPGDGFCETAVGNNVCTLRAAMQETNALGNGTIMFSVTGDLPLSSALPAINAGVNIVGSGTDTLTVRRSTGGDYRIFNIAANRTVKISNLTVRSGFANGSDGGGIANAGSLTLDGVVVRNNSTNGNRVGNGVFNDNGATLIVNNSYFFQNVQQSGAATNGGGIANFGTLNVRNSTFEGNSVGGRGGALDNRGLANIVNSTFSNNNITGSGAGGAGIHNLGGSATLVNVTLNENRADGGSGGNILVVTGTVNLRNTIVANGSDALGTDMSGIIVSNDYNLFESTSGATITGATAHNIIGTDPQLLPLALNGGTTRTHRPFESSPAIDRGAAGFDPSNNAPVTTDQRGRNRPVNIAIVADEPGGNAFDIGAFEVQASEYRYADLSIAKTVSANQVSSGGSFSYTVSVTNNGLNDAVNVVMGDSIPANLTYQSTASFNGFDNCTFSNSVINCTAATLPSGATATVIFIVSVNQNTPNGTVISNTASAVSSTYDPNPNNNSATATTTVVNQSDLAVTITDTPDPVVAGTNLVYTIGITNNGPSNAANTVLTDALPANVTFVSLAQNSGAAFTCLTPTVGSGGTVSCANSNFAAGASATFTLTVKVNSSAANNSTVSNTANVSTATTDPTTANNTASATSDIITRVDLSLQMTGSSPVQTGGNLTYTIRINNNGPSDAQEVVLTDSIPAGTTYQSISFPTGWKCRTPAVGSRGSVRCNRTTSPGGEEAVFALRVRVANTTAAGSTIFNQAQVTTDTTETNADNNSFSHTATIF